MILGHRLEVLCGRNHESHTKEGLSSQLCLWPAARPRATQCLRVNLTMVTMEMETNRSSALVTYVGVCAEDSS